MRAMTDHELLPRLADDNRRILLKNLNIISMDPQVGDFQQADLLIAGRKIAEIGPDIGCDPTSTTVIDAQGYIAIPGFHDTHRHSWQTQFRRMFVDIDPDQYMSTMHGKLAPAYRPEDSYIATLLAGLGALESGITCVLDYAHNTRSEEHADALVEGWFDAGIRAVHAQAGAALGDWNHQWPRDLERVQSKYFSSADQLVTLRIGLFGPLLPGVCEDQQVNRELLEYARGLDLAISVEAAMGPGAAQRLTGLGQDGLLGPDITYIHCLDLDDITWRHIADSGGHVSLAPTSDSNVGLLSAITPVQRALDMGIMPTLGCDVECTLNTDMYAQMQSVMSIQRMFAHNARYLGRQDAPSLVSARQVLEFATIAGAKANALDHKVGTLTPGKEADIVLINTTGVRSIPLNDAVGTVVMGTDSGNVDAVFVAGRARKWNGQLLDVDIESLRRRVEQSRDQVLARAGLSAVVRDN
jgi:cytosine/adenosine deaminase-related metal-dependent hydrolase